jgi:hypothetical protein
MVGFLERCEPVLVDQQWSFGRATRIGFKGLSATGPIRYAECGSTTTALVFRAGDVFADSISGQT